MVTPAPGGVNGNVGADGGIRAIRAAVEHFKCGAGLHQDIRRAAQYDAYAIQAQLGVLADGDGFKRVGGVAAGQVDCAGVNDQVCDVGGMVGIDGAGAVRHLADRQGAVCMGDGNKRSPFKGVFHVSGSRQGEGGGGVRHESLAL